MQKKTFVCFAIICFCILKTNWVTAQNFQWAYSAGSSQSEQGKSLAVDDNGNVYTVSRFDLDMGIFKNDATGNLVWSNMFYGNFGYGNDRSPSVTIDNDDNLYLTGYFIGTVDFDPGLSVYNLSAPSSAAYILKLDGGGNFVWAKMINGNASLTGTEIQYDSNGFVVMIGYCNGPIDLDPGSGVSNSTFSGGTTDAFVIKLDTAGNFVWGSGFGGTQHCIAFGLSIDAANNVIISGYFNGTVDFDPGPSVYPVSALPNSTAYILKLDPNGNFVWVRKLGNGLPGYSLSFAVTTDPSSNVYATGNFSDSCDFDPGAGVFTGISNGASDFYIVKLNDNGIFEWAATFGGPYNDLVEAITYSNQGAVIVTGHYVLTTDFDPGPGTFNLLSNGIEDAFLLSLNVNGSLINAKTIGGSGSELGQAVITDSISNIYVTGYFNGTVDFNPPFQYNLSSIGLVDIFITKYGPLSVGVQELNGDSDFIVYPNPGNGAFTFEFSDFYSGEYVISNLLGEQIKTGMFENSKILQCDIEGAAGFYFVSIKTGRINFNSKLVKN